MICAADILVEAGEHCQLDDLLVIDADVSQGPGRSARGPDDDRGTTGIGLGRARAQVCDATHRQPGRGPDRGWLVQDQQHQTVSSHEFFEDAAQMGLVVGHGHRVVGGFADIETDLHGRVLSCHGGSSRADGP